MCIDSSCGPLTLVCVPNREVNPLVASRKQPPPQPKAPPLPSATATTAQGTILVGVSPENDPAH